MKKITELPNQEIAHLHRQYDDLIKTLNEKPDKVKETENGKHEERIKESETKISYLTDENGNLKAENDTYKNKKIQLKKEKIKLEKDLEINKNENIQLKEDFEKEIEEKNKIIKDLRSIVKNANQTQTHHKGELEEEPTNLNVSIALVEDNKENEAPKENINDTRKKRTRMTNIKKKK